MADLTTLANVKAWLNLTDTSWDALITRLITATSADFLNEINRPDLMPATDYSERILRQNFSGAACLYPDFWCSQSIWLRHYPVNSVASVTIDGAVVDAVNSLVDRGWWFDSSLSPESRQRVNLIGWDLRYSWPYLSDVIVNYNGGYNTVPPAIEQAVIEWVAFKRGQSQLQQRDQSGTARTMGDYSETRSASELTVAVIAADIPENVSRVIDQYRRPVI